MEAGDILAVRGTSGPLQSSIVASYEGSWHHVALYLGEGEVIESLAPGGVRFAPLEGWRQGRVVDVLRLTGLQDSQVDHMRRMGRDLCGEPYNTWFLRESEGWYCSELVQHLFNTALGREVFPFIPMRFGEGPALAFWADYYRASGLAIPHGQPGTHPGSIATAPGLVRVGTLEA